MYESLQNPMVLRALAGHQRESDENPKLISSKKRMKIWSYLEFSKLWIFAIPESHLHESIYRTNLDVDLVTKNILSPKKN
jgi:hypothetical protein